MSRFDYIISLIIQVILIVFVIAISIVLFNDTLGNFEYTALDGNKGKASQCFSGYNHFICITEDGENIMVQSYKRV